MGQNFLSKHSSVLFEKCIGRYFSLQREEEEEEEEEEKEEEEEERDNKKLDVFRALYVDRVQFRRKFGREIRTGSAIECSQWRNKEPWRLGTILRCRTYFSLTRIGCLDAGKRLSDCIRCF